MERMIPLATRFHAKYEPIPIAGCWIWTGAVKESGHGVIGLGARKDRVDRAHRVSYRLHKGEIPRHLNVLHRCGVAACVNPEHLYLGTQKENARDMIAHGRHYLPDNRGERATWSKLKEEQVKEIVAAKATKKKGTGTALAAKFNVHKSTIYQIWAGANWTYLKSDK
jgi:hypothetical protein